jgi:uncharacterized protein YjbJ (UPF0337 family)
MGETIKIDPKRFIGPGATDQRKAASQQTGEDLSNVSKGLDIGQKTAQAPYVAGTAAAELTGKQQKLVSEAADVSGKEADRFNKSTGFKKYDISLPNFAAALRTTPNKEGDSELVMLSAKIQDPEGSVREGDEHRFNNLQSALEMIDPKLKEEFTGNGGMFTADTRKNIRRILANRLRAYNMAYKTERKRATDRIDVTNRRLKAAGLPDIYLIDPIKEVVGPHLGETYKADVAAYQRKLTGEGAGEEKRTVGLTEPLPPGAQIEGEDVKSYRFTPEQVAAADEYKKSKNFTAEGWADMITGFARDLGVVTPENQSFFRDDALNAGKTLQKAKEEGKILAPGFDYSKADEAATKNAGLFEGIAQRVRNLPESAAVLLAGATAIPKDAILSVANMQRTGVFKTFPDLAAELVRQAGGDPAGPTTQAFSKMLEENYGSMDNVNRYSIKDPLGFAGDLSMLLTGGGAAAAKFGRLGKLADVTKAGEAVRSVGRAIDPMSAITAAISEGAPALYREVKDRAPDAVEGAGNIPSNLVGWPSGAGGPSVREATASGFERGMAGAETPRSTSFTENMRNASRAAANTVAAAKAAVDRLRASNYQRYLDETKSLGLNPQPLDFDVVRQRMQDIKPANYDDYLGMTDRPVEHLAWERMNRTVEDYGAQAAKNPDLLLPINMDNFKQNLFDIGSKVTGGYDTKASGIADKAYGAVRGLIADADPLYDTAMKNAEEGIAAVKELEGAFSLAPGRDRRVNVDAATRKLQSVWRNNAGTNYNQRSNLADLLNQYDPEGVVRAGGAGQMLSSATPRGMSGTIAAGTILPSSLFNPATLALLPTLVPRVVGEAAYGLGRAAGTGARYGKALMDATETPRTALAELYNNYPSLALATTQAGSRAYQTERLQNQYGIGSETPSVPTEEDVQLPGSKPGTMMFGGREIEYDPATKTFVDTETGERVKSLAEFDVQGMYRGGLMALAQKYR